MRGDVTRGSTLVYHSKAVTWPDGGRLHPPRSRLHFTWGSPEPCFQPVAKPLWQRPPMLLGAIIAIFNCSNILSRREFCVKPDFVTAGMEAIFHLPASAFPRQILKNRPDYTIILSAEPTATRLVRAARQRSIPPRRHSETSKQKEFPAYEYHCAAGRPAGRVRL